MPESTPFISPDALLVLERIAAGHTYEQIIARHPSLTYVDIFAAAREALAVVRQCCPAGGKDTPQPDKVAQARARHPRAYLPWDAEEDATVVRMAHAGETVGAIAEYLNRQPTAVQHRMAELGLLPVKPNTGLSVPAHDGYLARLRKIYPRAYLPWSTEEDATLTNLARAGQGVVAIAKRLQRQPGAVRSRMRRLGLVDEDGSVLG